MLTPSISEANQNPGSQTGSQRRQTPGDAGRHPEKVSPVSWPFRQHQATSRGGEEASYKRGVSRFKSYCAHIFEYLIWRVATQSRGVGDIPCLNGARAVRQVDAAKEDAIHFAADRNPKPLAEPVVPVSRQRLSNLQAADSSARLASIPLGDVGVVQVVGRCHAGALIAGLEQRPARDRRPLMGQVPEGCACRRRSTK